MFPLAAKQGSGKKVAKTGDGALPVDEDIVAAIDEVAQQEGATAVLGGAGRESAAGDDGEAAPAVGLTEADFQTPVGEGRRGRKGVFRAIFDDGLVRDATDSPPAPTSADEQLAAEEKRGLVDAEVSNYEQVRASIMAHLDKLRRIDAIALAEHRDVSRSATSNAEFDLTSAAAADSMAGSDPKSLPEPGPPVDYCVFCYHGTYGLLVAENTALLTRFVSERGSILPRRFTKCCAKHQRALAATLRRSRNLNLIPFHTKLHPRLRFSSMMPQPPATLKAQLANMGAHMPGNTAPRAAPPVAAPPVNPVTVQQALNAAASSGRPSA